MKLLNALIKKIKTKNSRILVENFISLSSVHVLNLVMPLLVLPHLVSTLKIELYGLVVLGITLTNYFLTLTDYSFSITGTRAVSSNRNSPKRLNYIYSKILFVKVFFLLISTIIYFIVVISFSSLRSNYLIFLYSYPILIGYAFNVDWFFQGMEEMKYLTIVSAASKLFFAISILFLIDSSNDYLLHPIINSLSYLITAVISNVILFKLYKIRVYRLRRQVVIDYIKLNFPIFVNQFFPTFYNNSSLFLLGLIGGPSSLGLLDSIKKITDVCVRIINIFSRVFFPYLTRKHKSFNAYCYLMIFISGMMLISILLFNRMIFSYIGIDHNDSFSILLILSLGIVFIALYDIFGINYFIVKGMDKIVMYNTIAASLIGAILSVPAIVFFGAIGSALILTISRGFMGFGMLYKYLRLNGRTV